VQVGMASKEERSMVWREVGEERGDLGLADGVTEVVHMLSPSRMRGDLGLTNRRGGGWRRGGRCQGRGSRGRRCTGSGRDNWQSRGKGTEGRGAPDLGVEARGVGVGDAPGMTTVAS
jgi:hypothetical protein